MLWRPSFSNQGLEHGLRQKEINLFARFSANLWRLRCSFHWIWQNVLTLLTRFLILMLWDGSMQIMTCMSNCWVLRKGGSTLLPIQLMQVIFMFHICYTVKTDRIQVSLDVTIPSKGGTFLPSMQHIFLNSIRRGEINMLKIKESFRPQSRP